MSCEVSVGHIGKLECDFIMCSSEMKHAYVKMAMTIMNDCSTEGRGHRPLKQMGDNWPKFAITCGDPI